MLPNYDKDTRWKASCQSCLKLKGAVAVQGFRVQHKGFYKAYPNSNYKGNYNSS